MALVPNSTLAPALAPLALRAVAGSALAYHGYQKVDNGVSGFADFVGGLEILGVGLPSVTGYAVVGIELIGGLCLMAGLLTRVWAALIAVQFVMITLVVKPSNGLIAAPGAQGSGFEVDLLHAAVGVALVFLGPGLFAIDRLIGVEPDSAAPETPVAATA